MTINFVIPIKKVRMTSCRNSISSSSKHRPTSGRRSTTGSSWQITTPCPQSATESGFASINSVQRLATKSMHLPKIRYHLRQIIVSIETPALATCPNLVGTSATGSAATPTASSPAPAQLSAPLLLSLRWRRANLLRTDVLANALAMIKANAIARRDPILLRLEFGTYHALGETFLDAQPIEIGIAGLVRTQMGQLAFMDALVSAEEMHSDSKFDEAVTYSL